MSQVILTIVLTVGLPLVICVGMYLIRIAAQRLPEHTRLALEQFAMQAVRQVEQQNGTLSGAARKQLAIASVSRLLSEFGLPALPPEAIDIAIEAAVFLLPKTNAAESPKLVEPKTTG